MTVVVEGTNSFFFSASASLVPADREIASDWASDHINGNDAIRWILGKFVEADNANSNLQYWSLADLRVANPTIEHAPMNMLHRPRNIVGTYVGSELIYPNAVEDVAAEYQNPYIEALGAFWKYYFPEELAVIEMAHNQGSLFMSMECISDSITFHDSAGKSEEFPYMGPMHESYGQWNKDKTAIRQLNKPHFLAGALVIPPERPGWAGAEVKELSALVKEHQVEAEAAYLGIQEQAPHLDALTWEAIMLQLISKAKMHESV